MTRFARFYLIVDNAASLETYLPCGVKLVQLRVKNKSKTTIKSEISKARDACARYGAYLVVNDYWQAAIELGCKWVHLGQEDMDTADFKALKRAGIETGFSTHNEEELERALSHDPSYVALGPIYPTKLKAMPWAPQGLARITQWKRRIKSLSLVAIGGLTPELADGVFSAGADAVAVVSDVALAPDPVQRCHQWLISTRARQC